MTYGEYLFCGGCIGMTVGGILLVFGNFLYFLKKREIKKKLYQKYEL